MIVNGKNGKTTLLMSVIMSAPGPVILGLGLLVGRSSTQIADFIRRCVELVAIIIAFIIYLITNKDGQIDVNRKQFLERRCNFVVSMAMILSGIIMMVVGIMSSSSDKGNVIPGLVIALLGVLANSIFWIKYTRLWKETDNAILRVQSKLYCAKTLVDISVVIALVNVLLFPNSQIANYCDVGGTICVASYLLITGLNSLKIK